MFLDFDMIAFRNDKIYCSTSNYILKKNYDNINFEMYKKFMEKYNLTFDMDFEKEFYTTFCEEL